MKILLVEDEILIALEQRFYLESAGHEIFGPASTAQEAIALAREVVPDLALVDIHLAQNSSGIDAVEALTKLGIHCLYITSFRDEVKPGRPLVIGCLPKPFTENLLIGAVEVARTVLAGGSPRNIPNTMELFG